MNSTDTTISKNLINNKVYPSNNISQVILMKKIEKKSNNRSNSRMKKK